MKDDILKNRVLFENTITNMTNKFGERLYRSDNKAHIPYKPVPHPHLWGRLLGLHGKCDHTFEHAQYSTGGGWMADVFECTICTKCGEIQNWKRVY